MIVVGRVVFVYVVGEFVGVIEFDEFVGELVIWKFYVDAHLRGTGVGRRLLAAVDELLPADAVSVLIEHASENVLAASVYERLGFTVAWIDESDGPGMTTVWRRRMRDVRP